MNAHEFSVLGWAVFGIASIWAMSGLVFAWFWILTWREDRQRRIRVAQIAADRSARIIPFKKIEE